MKKFNLSSLFIAAANIIAALTIIIVLSVSACKASHISAGNITYQAQGNGQYLIRLILYRDCSGVSMLTSEYVYAYSNSNCSPDLSIVVNLLPNSGQQLPPSACVQGGNCYEEYIYEGTAYLPACNDWELFYTTCCRNAPDNIDNFNIPFNDFYISTTINNVNYPTNNSPVFNYAPIGTFCVNNNFFFDMGATDPDGDQISFSLIGAKGFDGAVKTPLFYIPPYNATAPLPCITPLTINSSTGLITFNPSSAGKFVIVVAVNEYDAASGALKGTVVRDMQVSVSANCNNIVPAFHPGAVSNGIPASCGDSVITIPLSANIQCGTVASDGSDFTVTSNASGALVPVVSASGSNCIIGLSNNVTLHLGIQLGGGSYTIGIKNGSDNNTLLSECGMPMSTSNTIQVNVSGNFTITTTHTDLNCTSTNSGSIAITASGLPGPFTYSIDGINYVSTNVFNGLSAGTYTVYASTGGNCNSSSTVTIGMPATVTTVITKSDISCFNLQDGSATVNVTSGTAPFQVNWNTVPAQSGITATNLPEGTYTATVTDANGCSAMQTITISRPDSIGFYTSASVDTICLGASAALTASATGGSGAFTYNWIPALQGGNPIVNPTQTTTYQVIAVDMNGCMTSPQSITVTVKPGITVVTTSDTAVCEGSIVVLEAIATGGNSGPYQYVWGNGGGNSYQLEVAPLTTTTYTITVNDGCTSPSGTKMITITVNPKPIPAFSADTTVDCYPLFGNFKNHTTISSGNISAWNWNFGDSSISAQMNPMHIYNHPGIYTVSLKAVSDKGCTAEITEPGFITVKQAPKPQVNFNFNPAPATILNPVIEFTGNVTGSSNYSWNFGDGSGSSILLSPIYSYGDTGHYAVSLTATNTEGCATTVLHIVEVLPVMSFFMPNAFSPNGDGINDYFEAKGDYIIEASLLIFNRWGQKVFESNSLKQGWDGTFNGQPASEGVYSYLVKTKGSDLKKIATDGTFILIR